MAVSRAALPVMSTYSCALWLAMLAIEHTLWPVFVLFIFNIYLMIELNNRNALMRQYSRMVSCSFIALMMMSQWLFTDWRIIAVQCCVILTLSLLFRTYQQHSAMGSTYWAYLFFGIATVIWPPMLYFLPFFWIAEAKFLMSFSAKSFWASIYGVLTPLWFLAPYIIYNGMYDMVIDSCMQLVPSDALIAIFHDPTPLLSQPQPMSLQALVAVSLVFLLAIIGIIHYVRNSYSDKIHVRMLYQFFILILIVALFAYLVVLLLPFVNRQSVEILYAIIVVCASPLLAHYIAFTNTRLTNISVIIFLLATFTISIWQILPLELLQTISF